MGVVFLSEAFVKMTMRDEVCLKRMALFFGKGAGNGLFVLVREVDYTGGDCYTA